MRTVPALEFPTLSLHFGWANGEYPLEASEDETTRCQEPGFPDHPVEGYSWDWMGHEQEIKLFGIKPLRSWRNSL